MRPQTIARLPAMHSLLLLLLHHHLLWCRTLLLLPLCLVPSWKEERAQQPQTRAWVGAVGARVKETVVAACQHALLVADGGGGGRLGCVRLGLPSLDGWGQLVLQERGGCYGCCCCPHPWQQKCCVRASWSFVHATLLLGGPALAVEAAPKRIAAS